MRPPARAVAAFTAALLIALGSSRGAAAQQAAGDDLEDQARTARESIADLHLDEAGKELALVKADRSEAGRKLGQELASEIVKAKKIAPIAQKIQKLLGADRARDAESLALATIDTFPGAVALAAVKKLEREARKDAFLVLGDFDEDSIDSQLWSTSQSTAELIDDGHGGHAVKWVCQPHGDHTDLYRRCKDGLNLDDFEYATVRIRIPKKVIGVIYLRFLGWNAAIDFASVVLPVKSTTDWQTVTVPLTHLDKHAAFDRTSVAFVDFSYSGPESVEVDFDDVMLAKK